jgi:hypothetical protein
VYPTAAREMKAAQSRRQYIAKKILELSSVPDMPTREVNIRIDVVTVISVRMSLSATCMTSACSHPNGKLVVLRTR